MKAVSETAFIIYPRFRRMSSAKLALGSGAVDVINQKRTMFAMAKKKARRVARDAHQAKPAPTLKMTRAEVERWREGWQRVNEFHLQEIREMTIEQRWERLNMLFEFALAMNWVKPAPEKELAPVRRRWARLKAGYP